MRLPRYSKNADMRADAAHVAKGTEKSAKWVIKCNFNLADGTSSPHNFALDTTDQVVTNNFDNMAIDILPPSHSTVHFYTTEARGWANVDTTKTFTRQNTILCSYHGVLTETKLIGFFNRLFGTRRPIVFLFPSNPNCSLVDKVVSSHDKLILFKIVADRLVFYTVAPDDKSGTYAEAALEDYEDEVANEKW